MKKYFALAVMMIMFAGTARADVFGERNPRSQAYKTSTLSAPSFNIDPGTLLDYLSQIGQYVSPKEGVFYDIDRGEFANYAGMTLFTTHEGVAFNVGALDTDGVAADISYNVGQHIPAQEVPIISLVEYLYVGFGIAERYEDGDWTFAYGPTAQFKFTY